MVKKYSKIFLPRMKEEQRTNISNNQWLLHAKNLYKMLAAKKRSLEIKAKKKG